MSFLNTNISIEMKMNFKNKNNINYIEIQRHQNK